MFLAFRPLGFRRLQSKSSSRYRAGPMSTPGGVLRHGPCGLALTHPTIGESSHLHPMNFDGYRIGETRRFKPDYQYFVAVPSRSATNYHYIYAPVPPCPATPTSPTKVIRQPVQGFVYRFPVSACQQFVLRSAGRLQFYLPYPTHYAIIPQPEKWGDDNDRTNQRQATGMGRHAPCRPHAGDASAYEAGGGGGYATDTLVPAWRGSVGPQHGKRHRPRLTRLVGKSATKRTFGRCRSGVGVGRSSGIAGFAKWGLRALR